MGTISLEEVREILGGEAKGTTDDQLRSVIANFDFLADWMLEEYEKKIFGKPLRELGVDNEKRQVGY